MRGRRGLIADTLGDHRLFAVAALHAARTHVSGIPEGTNLGYVLAMGVGMVPLAVILDWFAVKIAWASDFVILRVLFSIPGAVCTALALIGIVAWLYVLASAVVYAAAYVRAWKRGS